MKTEKPPKNYKISHKKAEIVSEAAISYERYPTLRKLEIEDDYSLIKRAKEGIKTDVFYSLADAIKMPEKTLASIINLSPRTISNYRSQEKHLDAHYSEHLLKLINLYKFGKDIFGTLEEFDLWLNRSFWGSEEKPIDFINTPGGVDLIHQEIEKLALGYPV